MTTEFDGAVSQVPSPPTTATIATTVKVRTRPPTATAAPRTRKGIVLPSRCPKPACRNGDAAIPTNPSGSRGWMPAPSRSPATRSIVSTSHMRGTRAPITTKPRVRSRSERRGMSGRVLTAITLRGLGQAALKPGAHRGPQAGAVGLEPVVAAQAHDLAAGRLRRHPERVALPLHDQPGRLDGLELPQPRLLGPARRVRREGQAEDPRGAGPRRGGAGDARAGRAPAAEQRLW